MRFAWSSVRNVAPTLLWALLVSITLPIASAAGANSNHVITISLDGLRPEFYLAPEFAKNCDTLTALRDRGSYAKGALPAYPSMTYPGHTTIATGVSVARHGITANNVIDPPKGDGRGFWYARDLQTPALWDVAHAAGLTVGSVSWPCNADSKAIDWNIPEFWTTGLGKETDLMRRSATPGLLDAIEKQAGALTAERLSADRDSFLAACAIYILREHKPNLMFVHLLETDKVQHKGGRETAELPAALRRLDGHVKAFLEAANAAGIAERTTFIVVGDHGFADVSRTIAPNWLLAKEGFLGETNWTAMVMNTGGSAGVYLKDPTDAATAKAVRALLEENADGLYRIIEKNQLVKLGGPRNATFYLEAEPGYMFSGSKTGDALVRSAPIKGNHGCLPTNAQMYTGFIASGRGIKNGVLLDTVRLVDVAPTVAQLLGLRLDNVDGRVLNEILE